MIPHPLLRKLNLLLLEEDRPWRQRYPGEHDKPENCDRDGDDPIDDEEPAPAAEATDTVEVRVGSGLQVSAKHGPEGVAHEPGASTFEQLGFLVPRPKDEVCPCKDGGFRDANQEAEGVELRDVGHL